MGFASTFALGVFGLFIAYVIRTLLKGEGDARRLPPGPKGLPVVGNISDMPKPGVLECHHWLEHKDKYGPISSVTVLGQTMVILNDPKVAFELLRDRSSIHSSRPHQNFSCDLVGWENAAAMTPYNDYWKSLRKNITQVASTNVSVSIFDRVQEEEAAHFLMNILDSPDELFDHIRTEAGAVILKITYGYIPKNRGKDALVDLVGKAMWTFAESTVPGKWAIDMFPFLKYLPDGFPGTAYRRTGREMRKILMDCADKPYTFVKQQMQEKKARTSVLSQAIESEGTDEYMDHVHKWTALSLFTGGADTTVSSLMTFFLAMTLFPEVQARAQEELDRVVGSERLPIAADKDNLPYIHAVMLETHRWHPVVPMGLPHTSDAEDMCQGYRIPKGSILLPNTWWFTHDPAVYPDPMAFRPERFLETPTHKPEPDPRNFIFGYGRRICPGRYVADNALFITIAQSLAVFNVTPISESEKPALKFEPGIISHPIPYKTNIAPRSEKHRQLIEKSEEKYPWEADDAQEMEKIM